VFVNGPAGVFEQPRPSTARLDLGGDGRLRRLQRARHGDSVAAEPLARRPLRLRVPPAALVQFLPGKPMPVIEASRVRRRSADGPADEGLDTLRGQRLDAICRRPQVTVVPPVAVWAKASAGGAVGGGRAGGIRRALAEPIGAPRLAAGRVGAKP
jgi:hypothetical protein